MSENNICGARTRNGTPCKKKAGWGTDHLGSGRCKFHGGASTGAPKGNQNARKHGIYSKSLLDDEKVLWDEIEIGDLEQEIKLCRIQLRRAFALHSENPDCLDFFDISNRLFARIGSLEKLQAEMMRISDPDKKEISFNMFFGKEE